tara:strand:- start:491 stop:844 length:354 start_codon:yes stop_codon:yes gene_type:complete
MDIEKIQKQVADLKTNVSLLQNASASEFNDDLVSTLHRISDVLDDLQPRLVDPADLSKEAEQKVLNTLSVLTARIDTLEQDQLTYDNAVDAAKDAIGDMDFSADVDSVDLAISVYPR